MVFIQLQIICQGRRIPGLRSRQNHLQQKIDTEAVYQKAKLVTADIEEAINSKSLLAISQMKEKLRNFRKAGLDQGGELSIEI